MIVPTKKNVYRKLVETQQLTAIKMSQAKLNSLYGEQAVTLEFKTGQLSVVSGANGSGKTSLLLSLLGENKLLEGSVTWNQDSVVAYLDQQRPWLMNTSIKNNILFFAPYKEKRYLQV